MIPARLWQPAIDLIQKAIAHPGMVDARGLASSSMSGDVEGVGPQQIDMLMASLRADESEAGVYFSALCTKLSDALGSRVEIDPGRGRFRRHGAPSSLSITLGDQRFVSSLDNGAMTNSIKHVVRDVALRSDDVALPAWLQALVDALALEAARSEASRIALERLLT